MLLILRGFDNGSNNHLPKCTAYFGVSYFWLRAQRLNPAGGDCAGMQHVNSLAKDIAGLLEGTCNPDPAQHGLTSEEERVNSSAPIVRPASWMRGQL